MNCSMPGFSVHHQCPELAQTHVYLVGDANPTISSSVVPFSSCLQTFPASESDPMSQFFTTGSWSFSFSISLSNEYSGLTSFRIDWFDLLAIQGQHQSLIQWVSSSQQVAGVSASASVFPMNIQDWLPLGLTDLILQSKGLSRVFSNTTVQKHQFFSTQLSL